MASSSVPNHTSSDPDTPPSTHSPAKFPYWRLVLSYAITMVLVYPIGRTVVVGLLGGFPEARFGTATLVGLAFQTVCCWNLASKFQDRRNARLADLCVWILWAVLGIVLLFVSASSTFGFWVAGPLFLLGTVPIVRLGWVAFDLSQWKTRLRNLVLLLPIALLFPVLITVTGLTGENKVQFGWRFRPEIEPGTQLTVDRASKDLANPLEIRFVAMTDSPQYLGINRTGRFPSVQLVADWGKSPPREVWRRPVGAGWSGVCVVGDYLFTQEQRGELECTVCYQRATGEEIWIHTDEARFVSSMGGVGPRATPLYDPDTGTLYVVGGTGLFHAIDASTGRRLWRVDLLNEHKAAPIGHGVCGSPLLVDEMVIVCPTGKRGVSLVAYDRKSGKSLWQGGTHAGSYASPNLLELAGKRQIVCMTADGVESVDPSTGKALWEFDWSNEHHVNCSQPVVLDGPGGEFVITSGYTQGAIRLRVQPQANGKWNVETVWSAKGLLKTKFTSVVEHQGFLYGLDDGILACVDAATGKQRWKGGRYKHGHLLLVGNHLIVQVEDPGDLVLVEANPKKLNEIARMPALAQLAWNIPTLAGKHLIVRNHHEMICYELALAQVASE